MFSNRLQAIIRPLTVGAIATFTIATIAWGILHTQANEQATLLITFAVGCSTALYFIHDARWQLDRYDRGLRLLDQGWETDRAIIESLRRSFCARGVAIALVGNDARAIYRHLGYRWYHIIPDYVVGDPDNFPKTKGLNLYV